MCWGQDGCQSKRPRAGSAWREPQHPWWGLCSGTRGPSRRGSSCQGQRCQGSAGTWPRSALQCCPPQGGARAAWHPVHPGLLQHWFLKHSPAVPGPAVTVAPGWHRDKGAGSAQHRGAGGRRELLTQHHGCLSPAAEFPKISRSVSPIPSLQLDPVSSATQGRPVPHWPWERSLPQSPALPQHPVFAKVFPTATVGQGHKDMRTRGHKDKTLQPSGCS